MKVLFGLGTKYKPGHILSYLPASPGKGCCIRLGVLFLGWQKGGWNYTFCAEEGFCEGCDFEQTPHIAFAKPNRQATKQQHRDRVNHDYNEGSANLSVLFSLTFRFFKDFKSFPSQTGRNWLNIGRLQKWTLNVPPPCSPAQFNRCSQMERSVLSCMPQHNCWR